MILADAHVHGYDCFPTHVLIKSALMNFNREIARSDARSQYTGVLFLTETEQTDCFGRLLEYTKNKKSSRENPPRFWTVHRTREKESLLMRPKHGQDIYIFAGRQLSCPEGLEVLSLSCTQNFPKTHSVKKLIPMIRDNGGIPVIPWGVGKWVGRRGAIVRNLIKASRPLDFFLGDNGGRPAFWFFQSHLALGKERGIKILPGSDPLPFSDEVRRIGSYGFSMGGSLDPDYPAQSMRHYLNNQSKNIKKYGELDNIFSFFRKQLFMRKRLKSK